MKIHVIGKESHFPDPGSLEYEVQPGLVAVGGDFSVERLLLAYRSGIFPWTDDPITWWSPDPRAIFDFAQFHIPRSFQRVVKRCSVLQNAEEMSAASTFEITRDRAFPEVVRRCATTRSSGNWITSDFISAYTRLHHAGYGHSVEVWQEGTLVGGIYGVAVGGLFAAESMFHLVSNASKVALYFLMEHLRRQGFILFDIQMLTPTTKKFGAIQIPRCEYLRRLAKAVAAPVSF